MAAARQAGERVGDSELGSGTAGGSEARQSRACRRPPLQSGPGEEGSRRTGEVGGGSGSGCVCSGGGRRCVRARLSPLSSCHQQPLLLQRSRAGESGWLPVLPAASTSRPRGSRGPRSRPASCVLPATSWLPCPLSPFRAGSARRRAHPSLELQATSDFPPPLRHRTLLRVPTVAWLQLSGALDRRTVS